MMAEELEGALLTDAETRGAVIEGGASVSGYGTGAAEHWRAEHKGVAKAQDLKTRRKLVERYDGLFSLAEQLMNFALEGDYANGVEFYGQDEGRVRAAEALKQIEDELKRYIEGWQDLKGRIEGSR